MKLNVGKPDRIVRFIIGLIILLTAFFGLKGAEAWALWVNYIVGAVLLLTGLFGFCPLYAILGGNTCPSEQQPSQPATQT